jgi:hypothetical protein
MLKCQILAGAHFIFGSTWFISFVIEAEREMVSSLRRWHRRA